MGVLIQAALVPRVLPRWPLPARESGNSFIHRFLAIWWPLKCQITKRRARMIIVVIWFIALTTTSPWLLFFDLVAIYKDDPDLRLCLEVWPHPKDETLFFLIGNLTLCYVLPTILISLCYILIWIKVWRRHIPSDTKDAQMERIQQKSKVKVVKMLVVVVILFVLSWLPLYVIFTVIKLGDEQREDEIVPIATPIAQWLGASNSCINPILYAFFNKKYRRGFVAILKSGRCCGKIRYYETVAMMSSSTSMRKSSYYVNNNNNNNNNSSTRRTFHGPPVHQESNVSYIFNHTGVCARRIVRDDSATFAGSTYYRWVTKKIFSSFLSSCTATLSLTKLQ